MAPGTERSPDRDALWALVRWVENEHMPTRLLGARFQDNDARKPVMARRPLCPHPELPRYAGGDPTLASSFRCQVRARRNIHAVAARYLD